MPVVVVVVGGVGVSVWQHGRRDSHLSSCVHIGALLDELSYDFHVTLFGGQMESIQTILERKEEGKMIVRHNSTNTPKFF